MNFVVLMIWWDPKNNFPDCYFCLTKVIGITLKSKHTVKHANNPKSVIQLVPHSKNLPVLKPLEDVNLSKDSENNQEHENEGFENFKNPKFFYIYSGHI